MSKITIDSSRGFHTIDIKLHNGQLESYKIPQELLVYEMERLLEKQLLLKYKIDESVQEQDVETHAECMTDIVFEQLVILLRHYQPEIDKDFLKENIYLNDAIQIVAMFNEEIKNLEKNSGSVKKKPKNEIDELKELRRIIIFCTRYGMGLMDVKHLYVDELMYYYKELIYTLENSGEIKEGTYDEMAGEDKTVDALQALAKAFKAKQNK